MRRAMLAAAVGALLALWAHAARPQEDGASYEAWVGDWGAWR